jgi:UDP-2,4-diacetamido-2,4,6-trideoxy-beta-L-altropyranose hydrolase
VARVLVFFGGIDAANNTLSALTALENTGAQNVAVDVVVGAAHSGQGEIEARCRALGFRCHVQPDHMAELMAHADLAIGAGGVTVLERCCVGLPAMSFVIATNQRRQVNDAAAAGLLYAPDPADGISSAVIERHCRALMENPQLRKLISARGMEAVDGRGTSRVLRRLGCSELTVREARVDDSGMLFEWRNHPSIRAVSRTRDPLGWERHQRWFASVLGDMDRIVLIGERQGASLGVVRFDVHGEQAEVSIHLAPENAGSGLGAQLLEAAERWLASARPDIRRCTANVLDDNIRSHRLFLAAGYRAESTWYSKPLAGT